MIGSEVLTAVRTATAHDADTQITDAQLYAQLGLEYQRLRRWVMTEAPELCKSQLVTTVASGASTIIKSALANFERLEMVERLDGADYFPISAYENYHGNVTIYPITVEEFPTMLQLRPESSAPGTYRVTWLSGVSGTVVAGTTIDLPGGLEHVLVCRLAAFTARRLEEDAGQFLADAAALLEETSARIRGRYGQMPVSGMRFTAGMW